MTSLRPGALLIACAAAVAAAVPASAQSPVYSRDEDGRGVFQFGTTTEEGDGPLRPGGRVAIGARVENLLTPGRYFVHFGVKRDPDPRAVVLHVEKALDFHVFGAETSQGVVELPHTIETSVEAQR